MNFVAILIGLMVSAFTLNFNETDTNNWYIVNDGVMGGLSEGTIEYTKNTVLFSGELSLKNNGGFASFQGPRAEYDLSKYDKVTIRHRGYGGTFGLRFKTAEPYYMPYFKVEFEPTKEWSESTFAMSDIDQWRLLDKTGKKISNDELASIIRMGIIKSDKKEVPFELEVDYIKFE
ncbi:MAG: CIA30 family protein [Flavobacteriales bacterium]|nr:CIA30 family protein [Flavobacteriales bacterium]